MKKQSLSDFARTFGSDYEGASDYKAFQVFYYWAECGCANLHECASYLTKTAKTEIISFAANILSDDEEIYSKRNVIKIINAILNTL